MFAKNRNHLLPRQPALVVAAVRLYARRCYSYAMAPISTRADALQTCYHYSSSPFTASLSVLRLNASSRTLAGVSPGVELVKTRPFACSDCSRRLAFHASTLPALRLLSSSCNVHDRSQSLAKILSSVITIFHDEDTRLLTENSKLERSSDQGKGLSYAMATGLATLKHAGGSPAEQARPFASRDPPNQPLLAAGSSRILRLFKRRDPPTPSSAYRLDAVGPPMPL